MEIPAPINISCLLLSEMLLISRPLISRELQKLRQRLRGQRRLKNDFVFNPRISRYSKVIFLCFLVSKTSWNWSQGEIFEIKIEKKKLHVLWTTQNLVISRCCSRAKKFTKNNNARAPPLFCLLFRDVSAAVAVVRFLNSLVVYNLFTRCALRKRGILLLLYYQSTAKYQKLH